MKSILKLQNALDETVLYYLAKYNKEWLPNDKNIYDHNFKNKFCICLEPYNHNEPMIRC